MKRLKEASFLRASKQKRRNGGIWFRMLFFVLMMVIAIGAGIITAVHEFVGNGEKNLPGKTELSENREKEGND